MDKDSVPITFTYSLGGSDRFVIGVQRESEVLYYEFLADKVLDVLNFVSRVYNSQAYTVKVRGVRKIYLLNDPSISIFFLE